MSTDTKQRKTQDASDVAARIETIFERIGHSGRQARLKQYNGICQFDIAPMGSWCVTMKDGAVHVTRGPASDPPARCVITCGAVDLIDIADHRNNKNLMTALLQETLTMTGDFPFGYTLLGGFIVAPSEKSRQGKE
jgi:hypothetical protein